MKQKIQFSLHTSLYTVQYVAQQPSSAVHNVLYGTMPRRVDRRRYSSSAVNQNVIMNKTHKYII